MIEKKRMADTQEEQAQRTRLLEDVVHVYSKLQALGEHQKAQDKRLGWLSDKLTQQRSKLDKPSATSQLHSPLGNNLESTDYTHQGGSVLME